MFSAARKGSPIMPSGKQDDPFAGLGNFSWNEAQIVHYPEVEFDIVELLETFVQNTLSRETRQAILNYWTSSMSKAEKSYIINKTKEKDTGLERLFQETNYCLSRIEETAYSIETFILAYGQPRVRKDMLSIISRNEKDSQWYKRYLWLTKRFHEDSIDLVYLGNINYFILSHQKYSLKDMLSVIDPLSFETQVICSDQFLSVICMRFVMDRETKCFIENPEMTKPIFYQLYLMYLYFWDDRPFFANFQGQDLEKLVRYAERRLSAVSSVDEGFSRLFDIYHCINKPGLPGRIANDILSRIEKKPGFNDTIRNCWESSVSGCEMFVDASSKAMQAINTKDKALHEAMVHETFVMGREAAVNSEIDAAVSEIRQETNKTVAAAKKEAEEAVSQVAKLRSQIAKLQSKIDAQAEEISELESENNDLSSRLDEADERLAEYDEMNTPETERVRLETDDPLPEDLELLSRSKIVVLGGHGNFHHQLLDRMPNWRCVVANKNVNTEDLVAHAEMIVFMTNHMSHSVFETNKQICINRKVPFVSMFSNNVTRCLNKIAKELRLYKD